MAIECLDALMNQTRSEDPIYDSPAKSPFLQAMLNVAFLRDKINDFRQIEGSDPNATFLDKPAVIF
jgi:hypothetical protein